jgi:hypothetical protein
MPLARIDLAEGKAADVPAPTARIRKSGQLFAISIRIQKLSRVTSRPSLL